MKKIKAFVICLLVIVLSGCMKVKISMDFDADGKAKMSMSMLMQESMMEMADMDIDDLKESFSSLDEDEFKFEKVEETIDDEKYVGWVATSKKAVPISSSSNTLQGQAKVNKKDNTITLDLDASSLTSSMEQSTGQYSAEDMKSYGVTMDLVFNFEGEVTSSNGKISKDKKSVTYDLLSFDEESIEIEAHLDGKGSSDQTIMYIVIGALVVAAIGAVAFFVIKKKNSNKDGDDMHFNSGASNYTTNTPVTPKNPNTQSTPVEPAPVVHEEPTSTVADTTPTPETNSNVESAVEEVMGSAQDQDVEAAEEATEAVEASEESSTDTEVKE